MDDPCWLIDLDGVIWLGGQAIPGGAEAVRLLRASGRRVAFFTNNSSPAHTTQVAKLTACGIEPDPTDVLTSAQAAARLVAPGGRAVVLGGPGILEALEARSVRARPAGAVSATEAGGDAGHGHGDRDGTLDAVVVGLDRDLDYARLSDAVRAVLAGATLVGTNDDPTLPTPDGLLPGAGAILAAVVAATGARPVVAGKPHSPAVELATEVLGAVTTVVGDRPSTDGTFARRLGARFYLVHSGVTPGDHGRLDPSPDMEATDLLRLVEAVLQG